MICMQLDHDKLRRQVIIGHMGDHVIKGMEPRGMPPVADLHSGYTKGATPQQQQHPPASVIPHDPKTDVDNASSGALQLLGGAVPLYQVVPHGLVCRIAHMGPVRSEVQVSGTFLSAPHGRPTIAFLYTMGLATLMAWDTQITKVGR